MAAWLVACLPDGLLQAISWTDPHIPWRSASSRGVRLFLLPDALHDRGLLQADSGHVVAFRPELPVPGPAFQAVLPAGNEERALPLQAAHEARHADLGRDADQHVHVVRHQVPLYYPGPLPLA